MRGYITRDGQWSGCTLLADFLLRTQSPCAIVVIDLRQKGTRNFPCEVRSYFTWLRNDVTIWRFLFERFPRPQELPCWFDEAFVVLALAAS
jgi:hypothetical protein